MTYKNDPTGAWCFADFAREMNAARLATASAVTPAAALTSRILVSSGNATMCCCGHAVTSTTMVKEGSVIAVWMVQMTYNWVGYVCGP